MRNYRMRGTIRHTSRPSTAQVERPSWQRYQTQTPICPHCNHEFAPEDVEQASDDGVYLYSLAANEQQGEITCPSCEQRFFVQGGYHPHFTTAVTADEL